MKKTGIAVPSRTAPLHPSTQSRIYRQLPLANSAAPAGVSTCNYSSSLYNIAVRSLSMSSLCSSANRSVCWQATLPHTPEPVFRYGRRSEPEPVDYSLHSAPPHRSPPLKQEEMSPSPQPSPTEAGGDGGAVLLASSTASLGRSRLLVKAATTVVSTFNIAITH